MLEPESSMVGASSSFSAVARARASAAAEARMASAARESFLSFVLADWLGREADAPDRVCHLEDLDLRNSAEWEDTVS